MLDDIDDIFRKLTPSQLCNELSIRFEAASIVYIDDDSQKLYDRLKEVEFWAFMERSNKSIFSDYFVEGFGKISSENVSFIRAPKAFSKLFSPPTQIGIEINNDIRASLIESKSKFRSLLEHISPYDFEKFIADILNKLGFKTILTPAISDNGVDIFAILIDSKELSKGEVCIVQCKKTKNTVGVNIVRELAGAKLLHRSNKALLVTSSHFSKNAHGIVKDPMYYNIELADFEIIRDL